MQLTSEEATRALAAIQTSREAMRSAVRAHRGHYHLWLWGVIWIAMALLAEFRGQGGIHLFPWLCAAGFGGSPASTMRPPKTRLRFVVAFAAVARSTPATGA